MNKVSKEVKNEEKKYSHTFQQHYVKVKRMKLFLWRGLLVMNETLGSSSTTPKQNKIITSP
jgi:hypothetical protein